MCLSCAGIAEMGRLKEGLLAWVNEEDATLTATFLGQLEKLVQPPPTPSPLTQHTKTRETWV